MQGFIDGSVRDLTPEEVEAHAALQVAIQSAIPAPRREITSYEFRLRFTIQERTAIRQAAQTDALIADWLDLSTAAQSIDLDGPTVVQGLPYLVAQELLTGERAQEIRGI